MAPRASTKRSAAAPKRRSAAAGLSIIVPVFNEAANLAALHERLLAAARKLKATRGLSVEIVYVDDGSRDQTLAVARKLPAKGAAIQIVSLSRNFGKEAALVAGLDHARGPALLFMDGDGQHPPELIERLVKLWQEDKNDVVFAVKAHRDQEPAIRLEAAVLEAARLDELVERPVRILALYLDARLPVEAFQALRARIVERRDERKLQGCETPAGRDPTGLQGAALARRDPGNEREIVVGPPACRAQLAPAADVAVLDGLGVRRDGWIRGDGRGDLLLEQAPGEPVVGHVVADPVALHRSGAPAEGDVHPIGLAPLNSRERVDVRADLKQGTRLRVPGELGVDDLVAPRTESAPRLDAKQEVRVTEPAAVEERRLIDDVVAPADRGLRLGGGAA